jgi:hypothetical protein
MSIGLTARWCPSELGHHGRPGLWVVWTQARAGTQVGILGAAARAAWPRAHPSPRTRFLAKSVASPSQIGPATSASSPAQPSPGHKAHSRRRRSRSPRGGPPVKSSAHRSATRRGERRRTHRQPSLAPRRSTGLTQYQRGLGRRPRRPHDVSTCNINGVKHSGARRTRGSSSRTMVPRAHLPARDSMMARVQT